MPTPVSRPEVPAAAEKPQTPLETLVDAYEVEDGDLVETPTEATPPAPKGQRAPVEAPAPSTPKPQPRDESGKFLSPAEVTGEPESAHDHPQWLVQLAADVGLSEEDIASTPTEELGKTAYHLQRVLRQQDRLESRANTVAAAREQGKDQFGAPTGDGSQSARQAPAEKSPLDGFDFGTDEEGKPIREEHYDKGIMKLFRQQQTLLAQLQAQVRELSSREVNRENMTVAQRIDRRFEKLNDARFGSGSGRSLKGDSAEYGRRLAVLNEARRLAGDKATAEQQLAKFDLAVRNLYGDAEPEPPANGQAVRRNGAQPRRQHDEDLEAWQAAGLARPTQRIREPKEKGVRKAEAAVAKHLQQTDDGGEYDLGDEDFLE